MQTEQQRLVERNAKRKVTRKAARKTRRKTRRKARQKAKAFVKKVKRDGSWPFDDTELVCEAFELAYALADVELT